MQKVNPLSVTCPFCGERPGKQCRSETLRGAPHIERAHRDRYKAARKAGAVVDRYQVGPGRYIERDGVEIARIERTVDDQNRATLSPVEADDLTALIVRLLNEHDRAGKR